MSHWPVFFRFAAANSSFSFASLNTGTSINGDRPAVVMMSHRNVQPHVSYKVARSGSSSTDLERNTDGDASETPVLRVRVGAPPSVFFLELTENEEGLFFYFFFF